MFEQEYEKFVSDQSRHANGMRSELLKKHGAGERKLLELLWAVFRSFEGLELEYEIVTSTGVRNYIDVFYKPLRIAFEAEGFVVHAEKITRDRFDGERNKARSLAIAGITYFPFTWDDMDKRPDTCRRALFELLGQRTVGTDFEYTKLSPSEREIVRMGMRHPLGINIANVRDCLGCSIGHARKVFKSLTAKRLLRPENPDAKRRHRYVLEDDAYRRLR